MNDHWAQTLYKTWGIKARLTALDGEYDLNLKAECEDGTCYLLKVMRVGCDPGLVDMQCQALQHIHACASSGACASDGACANNGASVSPESASTPTVIQSKNALSIESLRDQDGQIRLLWVLSFIEGVVYAHFTPKSADLISQLGTSIARLHDALSEFQHASLERDFKWNLVQASWVDEHLSVITDSRRRDILASVMTDYHLLLDTLQTLPPCAIHNDINDHNLLVTASLHDRPAISGVIDFGDMCLAPRVCDLAIAGAYIVLDHPQPDIALCSLVRSYHAKLPLLASEIDLIYTLLCTRLAVSVVNSTIESIRKPDDPYVVISQAPAWRFLEHAKLAPSLVCSRLRVACGLPVTDTATRVHTYLAEHVRENSASILNRDLSDASSISLSVEGSSIPQDPFELSAHEAESLATVSPNEPEFLLGLYNEPRLIYTDSAFRPGPWKASNRLTVHLGIDVFAPAGTEVRAPLDGVVSVIDNRTDPLDYGGMVVLEHQTPTGDRFYSLYGHLNPTVCQRLQQGQGVKAGEVIGMLGTLEQNGGWSPHLHLQLAINSEGLDTHWPGVADPDELEFWNAMCPNPAALLNLPDKKVDYAAINESLVLQQRQQDFGENLKLSYREPVMLLRGWKHYLFDQWGRTYLDAYNNVPHVGHAHPRVQSVVSEQLKRLNTNTRYLHPAQSAFARKLISKMPESLCVCYFVNSGSEANELALRLARAYTGGKSIITPDHGYHGNTTGAIDISAYKFNAPGGVGKPDWVSLVDIPDCYAGTYREPETDCAMRYADQVDAAIAEVSSSESALAGFIAETFPSVGGQVIPPPGYLLHVYQKIRAAGGVCIADEVQTGLGRLGHCYFAFEQQLVEPDIVVLGKPIGNGHPIGVVVTTREIANSFAEGPEFFSTFGGSTLSCRVGKEVLDIVDEEALQKNALDVGNYALEGLAELQKKHPVIGDVRGLGLFIGVAFVTNQASRSPASAVATYVVNRLRDNRIFAGLEGPRNNVLKIRPPLTITKDDIDMLLHSLNTILAETAVADFSE